MRYSAARFTTIVPVAHAIARWGRLGPQSSGEDSPRIATDAVRGPGPYFGRVTGFVALCPRRVLTVSYLPVRPPGIPCTRRQRPNAGKLRTLPATDLRERREIALFPAALNQDSVCRYKRIVG
jgi:hypothetical protein